MSKQPSNRAEAAGTDQRGAPSVRRDLAEMWVFARHNGIAREMRSLHRPVLAHFLRAATLDWLLIMLATATVVTFGWAAVPTALLVIGNRQRALGNLLHDASHRSLDRNRRRSGILADLLFCRPLWISMAIYRVEHNRHHKFLGDPARDPDFIHDEKRLALGWVSVWLDQVLSPRVIRGALLGHIGRMDAVELAGVVCWWGVVLAAIAFACNPHAALLFLALWIAAKALVFHPITAFREISDHVGLDPGGLIGFSRNHSFDSVLGQFIHPHHNGYHLLHHLTPGMPFHALPRAHALLMSWPRYAAGEHCGSYFIGATNAVRSWTARSLRPDPAR